MTTDWVKREVGRLAFRVEGEYWNVYYALPDTLKDAIYLGTIKLSIVAKRPDRKQQFMALMTEAMGDIIEDAFGHRPEFNRAHRAPESERSES